MRLVTSILVLVLPGIALAAPTSFKELTEELLKILNAGIASVLILGLVIYFYGISTSIPKLTQGTLGKGEMETFRVHIVWGVVALFVMVSVWGVLALVQNSLFSSNVGTGGGQIPKQCASYSECVLGGNK